MNTDPKPWYWQLPKHRFNRRAHWHDYTSPCFYMITISRHDNVADSFSIINDSGKNGFIAPEVKLTEIGKIILAELFRVESQYPDLLIRRWVIMPDHIHFVIWVKNPFPLGLGKAIGFFKGNVTKRLREINSEYAERRLSVFSDGFHDRILTKRGMLQNLLNYVDSNPLRLLRRRRNKDNFIRREVRIGEVKYCAYGNLNILTDPWRIVIRWSSKYRNGEWEKIVSNGREIARCGGVLISPFINRYEKDAMKELMLIGARVVKLTEYSIGERWHAKGEDFDLCSKGKLLLLGRHEGGISPHIITRREAMTLNEEARAISNALRAGDYRFL